jgi:glycosyltransferase involved in cell wall biosynthesis
MGGDIAPLRWVPGSRQEAWLSPFALGRADAVLAWSNALLSTVEAHVRSGARRAVINGGVDLERFSMTLDRASARRALGLPADGFVIFSPRLLWPRHHAESIVRAFVTLAASHANARLLVVWYRAEHYPEYAERVRSAITTSGVAERISIVEEIPHSDMQTYYAAADCTVSLSSMDGTPMTVQESLACGTPAIVFDLPEYDPAIYRDGETVLRIPLRDETAIATAFLRLAQDAGLRARMAGLGRDAVVTHADIRDQMDHLERIYLDLARQ